MNLIDRIHPDEPYLGTRGIKNALLDRGHKVGRHHVRALMWKMGIEALYQKSRLSKPHPGHTIYPYLLKGVMITEASKVWVSDTLHPYGARFLLPGCRNGFGKQESPLLEVVQYARYLLLH